MTGSETMIAGAVGRRVLEMMCGTWSLERAIDDGTTARGEARFVRQADGSLDYTERVRMSLATGRTLDATQRLRYRTDERARVIVERCDPLRGWSVLHRLAFEAESDGWSASDVHLCGRDRYAVTLRVQPSGLTVVYRVLGPAKGYFSTSVYTRKTGELGASNVR